MKKIFDGVLNFFGLRGNTTKGTVCKIVNWITYVGLLVSVFDYSCGCNSGCS